MKILVTGVSGQVGSAVAAALLRRGAHTQRGVPRQSMGSVAVRGYARHAPPPGTLPPEVEMVQGDLLDPAAFERALEGIDKLFLLNAVAPDELTQGLIGLGLAKRCGLRHVTYFSVYRAGEFPEVPHFASKAAIEHALRESGVPYTILRPGYFFQNDARHKALLTGPGIYPVPIGAAGIAAADVRDIAEAAAITLTGSGHEGQSYTIAGPGLLSGPGAAACWSEALGRPVRYPGENFDEWERQMRAHVPGWMAFDLRSMFAGYTQRGFASTAAEVERLAALLGHRPRGYEAFVRETAASWKA